MDMLSSGITPCEMKVGLRTSGLDQVWGTSMSFISDVEESPKLTFRFGGSDYPIGDPLASTVGSRGRSLKHGVA